MPKTAVCRRCHGRGGDVEVLCPSCGGTGADRSHESAQCQDCAGDGTIQEIVCPDCNGEGMQHFAEPA